MSPVRNGVLVGQRYAKQAKLCPTDHGGGHHPTAPMVPHSRRQHTGWLFCAAAPGVVGHHCGRCWPFRSRNVNERCGVFVVCILHRNMWGGVPANCRCLHDKVRKSIPSASEPLVWQPSHPRQIGRCATFTEQGHNGGMMCCSGGVKVGGRGAGGDNFYRMWTRVASMDDGCRCHPTAATEHNFRLWAYNNQQTTSLKLEKLSLILCWLELEKLSLIMLISNS